MSKSKSKGKTKVIPKSAEERELERNRGDDVRPRTLCRVDR